MPLYRYQALSNTGKKISGVMEADSLLGAKERLKARRIMVVALEEEKKKAKGLSINASTKLAFVRELSQLLKAGLPLFECLAIIEEKSRKEKHYPLLIDFLDRLKQGTSLSTAMKNYPKVFNEIDCSMIAAAEETGTLPQALSQLAQYLDKQARFKKQIISVTAYPLFLLGFAFLLLAALLFFLIPSMQELYEGRDLQPLTQAIISLSIFCRHNVLGIFALFSLPVVAGYFIFKKPAYRREISIRMLNFPFVGDIILQMVISRFSRTASLLLQSGLPLLETLKLSRPTLKSPYFEEALLAVEAKILEGKSLHEELKMQKQFPLTVIRLLAIAEETGKMKEAFENIVEIYDEELTKSLENLTTVLQPALLLLLGLIVGVMVLAVLLPLTDVSSFLNM
jgi:general secretion pathway protein F